MNPFILGLTALSAANNPQLAAQSLSASGISPEALSNVGFGNAGDFSMFDPAAGATAVPGAMMAEAGDGGIMPLGAGGAEAGTGAGANPMAALSGLGGITAPQAPRPVHQGGIYGAQGAPKAESQMQSQNAMKALQMLMQGSGGGAPSLGALLGGGRR